MGYNNERGGYIKQGLDQLVDRYVRDVEAPGSNPGSLTNKNGVPL